MYATIYLESYINGQWHRIGWDGSTPKRADDLREHGRKMAESGGYYRITRASIYAGAPDEIVYTYPVVAHA